MRLAGAPSWQLASTNSQLCELALFVRDAVGLDIESPDVPSLVPTVPALTHVLDADLRHDASDQWRGWWMRILDLEFRDRRDEFHDPVTPLLGHEALCDPPDFTSLVDRRPLQLAAQAGFPAFRTWENSRPPHGPHSPPSYSLIKQTAEDVAFDRRVSPDLVQAKIVILPVEGLWWRRVRPGAVLCSSAAASDGETAQRLLRDAFDSFVARSD